MRKDDFEKFCTAIFVKLDKIYDKVENKVDKHEYEVDRRAIKSTGEDIGIR